MPDNFARHSKYFAIFVVASTLLYLWPGEYWLGHRHWVGGAVIIVNFLVCVEYNHRYSPRHADWGLSWQHFLPALGWAMLCTGPFVLAFFCLGWQRGTISGRTHPLSDLTGLFLWAWAQQFALQTVLFRELRKVLRLSWAITATALVFALLHLPNPFLIPLTLCGGYIWCWIFSRHPNLLPLALSQSLCSLTILAALSKELTGSMRVGFSYFLR